MKKTLYAAALVMILAGCTNAKQEEKAIQKEVLDSHDKIMTADIKAADNKMKLDTMIKKADSLKIDKQAAITFSTKLEYADNTMTDWMTKLDIDNTGKNHDDIMKYWRTQKVQVKIIDSLLTNANAEAEAFIQKTTKK